MTRPFTFAFACLLILVVGSLFLVVLILAVAVSMVISNASWFDLFVACAHADSSPSASMIRHREASRFIAASIPGAGGWLECAPDASVTYGGQRSDLSLIAWQRRAGLYLSIAKAANDAAARLGLEHDYLGDTFENGGGHTKRHNAANLAIRDALVAVATSTVLVGDREKKSAYQHYNAGRVPDLIQPGASPWGTDWLGETKVPSPLTSTPHAGHGSSAYGGSPADVGHLYALGNTEVGGALPPPDSGRARSRRRSRGPLLPRYWTRARHAAGRPVP